MAKKVAIKKNLSEKKKPLVVNASFDQLMQVAATLKKENGKSTQKKN